MKKTILLLSLCSFGFGATHTAEDTQIEFPKHIDECVDGYLYRLFVNSRNQIIPGSIHQVMEKSALHEKMLPKECSVESPKSKQ